MGNLVSYKYEEHLITDQNNAEAKFLAAFEKAAPELAEAHVIVNPYLINPLAALILFKTKKEVPVTITVHGKRHARENLVHTFEKATSHVIPAIGLYEGIKTKITVQAGNESKEFFIEAEELPADVCRCLNIMTTFDYFGNDIMTLTPADKNYAVGYDYKGDLRWILSVPTMFDIKRLKNGNILTGSHRYSRLPYFATGLIELSMTGKIVKEYRMPGNYHHDHWELRDGNLMSLTQDHSEGKTTVEDMIALLDRKTGKVLRTWDFKDFLPQDQGGSGSQSAHDWFHNNALWVDEDNKTITLSGRHQDAIVNFSYEENGGKGRLNWIIGNPDGWSKEMQKYFFKPVGDLSKFDWQYEQHACILLPDGDVMAFDNGQYRSKIKEKYIRNRDNFSRGVRYRINTEKMEIEQVWQFGKEWGQEFYSGYICNVEYYADGHYMIHSGGIGIQDGYASDIIPGLLARSEEMKAESTLEMCSKTVEEKDGVTMFYIEVPGNFYRAERLSIYHDGNNQPLGEGKLVGELDITPPFSTIPEAEEVIEKIPAKYQADIIEEEDKLVLTAKFPRGSLAMWVIEGSSGDTFAYYISTALHPRLAMCSAAYLEADADVKRFSLSKRGLSGKYEIKVIIDDKKYQTGISFFC